MSLSFYNTELITEQYLATSHVFIFSQSGFIVVYDTYHVKRYVSLFTYLSMFLSHYRMLIYSMRRDTKFKLVVWILWSLYSDISQYIGLLNTRTES